MKKKIEEILKKQGYGQYKWITGKDVEVKHWVRMKCMFGCTSYGQKAGCPPAVPSIQDCQELFKEFNNIMIIKLTQKFDNPTECPEWSRKRNKELLNLEKEIFLAGFPKVFLLFMDECRLCNECAVTRQECKNKAMSRPSPEALGVDVFTTVQNAGFEIKVLKDISQTMDRFAFILID